MSYCIHCGEEIDSADYRCPFCGERQSEEIFTEESFNLEGHSRSALRAEKTRQTNLTYAKQIFKENTFFISGCLLIALVTLVVMPPIGMLLLLGTAALLAAPIFLMAEPSIDYFAAVTNFLKEKNHEHKQIREKNARKKAAEQARLQEEEQVQRSIYEEPIEELPPQQIMKQPPLQTSHEPRPSIPQARPTATPYTAPNIRPFKVRKKGRILNLVFLGGSCFGLFSLLTFISGFFGLPGFIAGAPVTTIYVMIFLFSFLFYLPTFIYHASFFGKIWTFILNTLFGLTGIGWIILLIRAFGKNRQEAYRQEMRYYQKYDM